MVWFGNWALSGDPASSTIGVYLQKGPMDFFELFQKALLVESGHWKAVWMERIDRKGLLSGCLCHAGHFLDSPIIDDTGVLMAP